MTEGKQSGLQVPEVNLGFRVERLGGAARHADIINILENVYECCNWGRELVSK